MFFAYIIGYPAIGHDTNNNTGTNMKVMKPTLVLEWFIYARVFFAAEFSYFCSE